MSQPRTGPGTSEANTVFRWVPQCLPATAPSSWLLSTRLHLWKRLLTAVQPRGLPRRSLPILLPYRWGSYLPGHVPSLSLRLVLRICPHLTPVSITVSLVIVGALLGGPVLAFFKNAVTLAQALKTACCKPVLFRDQESETRGHLVQGLPGDLL